MFLRIEKLAPKLLAGKSMIMNLADNKTFLLWSSFMPELKSLKNRKGNELYSVQVYDAAVDFNQFNESTAFCNWAAAEIFEGTALPEGWDILSLNEGTYAVFLHKGTPATFSQTFEFIHSNWLPASGYELDNRPHFEIMGEKYKNNDPASEEEVWIPVRIAQ